MAGKKYFDIFAVLEKQVFSLTFKFQSFYSKIRVIFFEIINKWIYNKENASFPNGENLIDINKRIEYLIKKYFNINENIILVGHSVMFAILMSRFKIVKDIKKLFLKRGGIAKFSILKKEFEIPG